MRREQARKKLIAILTRKDLDNLIGNDHRPWNMDLPTARSYALHHWRELEDEIADTVGRIIKSAEEPR